MVCPWLKKKVKKIVKKIRKYPVVVEVANCFDAKGGYIYVGRWDGEVIIPGQGNDEVIKMKKYRKVAKWGLRAGNNCCRHVVLWLPEGHWLIRANCGYPKLVKVPEVAYVELCALNCYGSTDNLEKGMEKYARVMVMADFLDITCVKSKLMFGVDSTSYIYSIPSAVYLKPGKHVIYFNDGTKREIRVERGHEYLVFV